MKNELDRRRKYYLILDCETATLPCVKNASYDSKVQQVLGLSKPLIYDLGWTVTDKKGRIYKRKRFIISEIFSVPAIFNTAYYAGKRPQYIDEINGGAVDLVSWKQATDELVHDMELVAGVGAYNANFDFQRAIPFTEEYINALYSNDYYKWEQLQISRCDFVNRHFGESKSSSQKKTKRMPKDFFIFREKMYPLFDVWNMACEVILNNDEYRNFCKENNYFSESGKYYKTSAEIAYRYAANSSDFIEAHTSLDDAEIESFLFAEAIRIGKLKEPIFGIVAFPMKKVGEIKNP